MDRFIGYMGALLSIVGSASALAASPSVTCLGPVTGQSGMIYFHGLADPSQGPFDKRNIKVLEKLAGALNMRIALPRSPWVNLQTAVGSKVHWPRPDPRKDDSLLAELSKHLAQAEKQCFPKTVPVGLLGFSNGGYLVSYLMLNCLLAGYDWSVGIGSGPVVIYKRSGAKCTTSRHLILAGTKDRIHDRAERFSLDLRRQGYKVTFGDFPGGHRLPDDLTPFIRPLLKGSRK